MSHNFLELATTWANDRQRWPFEPQFDPEQRWYRRLFVGEGYEVWLLTWLPGQSTDLHDHGTSAGAFTVLSGQLTELTPRHFDDPQLNTLTLPAGGSRSFGKHYIHQVVNRGDQPVISVHAYGPALKTMRRYEITDLGLRLAAVDQAGTQW